MQFLLVTSVSEHERSSVMKLERIQDVKYTSSIKNLLIRSGCEGFWYPKAAGKRLHENIDAIYETRCTILVAFEKSNNAQQVFQINVCVRYYQK